jgi:hypothetical protein
MTGRMVCCALLMCALSQGADLYHVAGVVLNSETGAPLPRANVGMRPENGQVVIARQVTGPDGRFSFELPQGMYHLTAGTRDALEEYGYRTPESRVGTGIITGPGKNTSNLVFRWHPPAAITGRITDETGDPVENALIQLIASRTNAGRHVNSTSSWARTNDRGEYRFWRLPGGTYYLAVTAEPWYAERVRLGKPDANVSTSYGGVYYPNTPDASHAAALALKPGDEARADFSLRTVPGATVTVSYEEGQHANGLLSLIREGLGGTDGFERQLRTGSGNPALRGVPPGRYLLRVSGTSDKGPVGARQWIDVNGSDIEVKLNLRPAPSVSGTLEWRNPALRPRGTVLAMMYPEEPRYAGSTVSVRPDGTFTIPSLLPGRYRPAIRIGAYYLNVDVHVEGADLRDGVVSLLDDEAVTIRVIADGATGTVKGFVMHGEQPRESVMVAFAPVQDTNNWLAYKGYQTDSDGSYVFENMPVGEYFLFAVDDVNLEYTNPAAVRRYYPSATRIRVEAGKILSQKIDLLERIAKP